MFVDLLVAIGLSFLLVSFAHAFSPKPGHRNPLGDDPLTGIVAGLVGLGLLIGTIIAWLRLAA